MIRSIVSSVFFFQAEDGIRDLVRSRGLGDVYKRQVPVQPAGAATYVSVMSSTAGFAYGEDPSVLYVKTKRTVVPAKAVRSICGRAVKPVSNGVVYVARTVPAGRVPETGAVSYTHLTLPTGDLGEISVGGE